MIFGFGHRRYVGKDTAARFLANHVRLEHGGIQVQKISFATKLKWICHDLLKHKGLMGPDYYESNSSAKDKVVEALGKSPRDIWIKFGNDIRDIYHDVWVDYALNEIIRPVALIPDVRYHNEAEAIKAKGGILIKITRQDVPEHDDVADSRLADWDGWDYHINNNADLNYLHRVVLSIVDTEMKKDVGRAA